MKTSVKVTLRDGEGREEAEVVLEFDLENEGDAVRFHRLREMMKESATLTSSRQHFFYQLGALFESEPA